MAVDRSLILDVVSPKPRVRDRIFATACELFYKRGIRDVGVDAIATAAGTNKMSFYRSFASKDELVVEYLEQKSHAFWAWWDATIAPHEGEPRRQIEALFDAFVLEQWCGSSRGCPMTNAAVELAAAEHPGRQVAIRQKLELRRRFRRLAADAGAALPAELGDALMLLIEGGALTRQAFEGDCGPQQHAAMAARVLIDAYTRAVA